MANVGQSLENLLTIDGAFGAALVDWRSGLTLGTVGGQGKLDMELAASANTQVVRAKMSAMEALGIKGAINDILITLDDQLHIIRPLRKYPELFLYLAIDKAKGNTKVALMAEALKQLVAEHKAAATAAGHDHAATGAGMKDMNAMSGMKHEGGACPMCASMHGNGDQAMQHDMSACPMCAARQATSDPGQAHDMSNCPMCASHAK